MVECKPPRRFPPGAWLGHLRVGYRAAGGEGDEREPELELGMVGGTSAGWESRGIGPQSKSHGKPVQAQVPAGSLRGSGRVRACVPYGTVSLESAASEHFIKELTQLLPCPGFHPLPWLIATPEGQRIPPPRPSSSGPAYHPRTALRPGRPGPRPGLCVTEDPALVPTGQRVHVLRATSLPDPASDTKA